jgi:predicted hydrolase (HD superfamily)
MELKEENASLKDGQALKVQQMNKLQEQLTKAQEALVKKKKTTRHENKKCLAANANLKWCIKLSLAERNGQSDKKAWSKWLTT